MSEYTPQKGDRVDVTLLGAKVTGVEAVGTGTRVKLWHRDASGGAVGIYLSARLSQPGLMIEKVTPPLPTTPGSVVRYCGLTFMRRSDGEWVGAHPEKLGRSNFLYGEVPPEQCEVIFDAGQVTP